MIERLRTPEEAQACATLMAESEPWLTLRFNHAAVVAVLNGPTTEVYLARLNGEFTGHIQINMSGAFAGYIQTIAVAPAWRNQGIGEALIHFAEQRIFRDSPNVFLCVSDFNLRAQKLYARLGYERVGELKDYVIAGASEFLLRKTISPKRDFKRTS
jgi:ribosomal protein S18 acetylase RimI-like enzyme